MKFEQLIESEHKALEEANAREIIKRGLRVGGIAGLAFGAGAVTGGATAVAQLAATGVVTAMNGTAALPAVPFIANFLMTIAGSAGIGGAIGSAAGAITAKFQADEKVLEKVFIQLVKNMHDIRLYAHILSQSLTNSEMSKEIVLSTVHEAEKLIQQNRKLIVEANRRLDKMLYQHKKYSDSEIDWVKGIQQDIKEYEKVMKDTAPTIKRAVDRVNQLHKD